MKPYKIITKIHIFHLFKMVCENCSTDKKEIHLEFWLLLLRFISNLLCVQWIELKVQFLRWFWKVPALGDSIPMIRSRSVESRPFLLRLDSNSDFFQQKVQSLRWFGRIRISFLVLHCIYGNTKKYITLLIFI